jgi:aryl-alcohol dehydrogenase-like predicted oxidoreductase
LDSGLKTSFNLLVASAGGAFTLIDTAGVYSRRAPGNSGGKSETIIGNCLKLHSKRQHVVIATKGGGDTGQGKKDISKIYHQSRRCFS